MAKFEFNDYGNASSNAFMGDFGNREHILAGGAQLDAGAVYSGEGAYTITLNDAEAEQGDTTITVLALPVSLPDGAQLQFGSVTVTLNGAKAAGQTSLTVVALGGDITNGATATYDASPDSNVVVSGTLVGRTVAERNSGDSFGPAADADDEIFITIGDVNLDKSLDVDLVRHGSSIKTNFLPAYTAASSAIKAKLEAKYQLILG